MRVEAVGEASVRVTLGHSPSELCLTQLRWLQMQLNELFEDAIVDCIPAYTTLLVEFDPWLCTHEMLCSTIESLLEQLPKQAESNQDTLLELPVWYDESVGPDLASLAASRGWEISGIIQAHSQQTYRVYAIGFAPGFAYLGDVVESLATPRHANPRKRVVAGSVAIADRQTAVYPADSPGGWQIIGRCPLSLFDLARTPASPFVIGGAVRFRPVDQQEFEDLGGQV